MAATSNCPNCGAPAKGPACEYCGTVFAPQSALSLALGRPVSIRFEHDGMVYEFDMVVERMNVDYDANPTHIYDYCGSVVSTLFSPTYEAEFGGRLVPADGGSACITARRADG